LPEKCRKISSIKMFGLPADAKASAFAGGEKRRV